VVFLHSYKGLIAYKSGLSPAYARLDPGMVSLRRLLNGKER